MNPLKSQYSDREIINKWIVAFNNLLVENLLSKMDLKKFNTNSFIGFCYVDHDAGISIRIHALCFIRPKNKPAIVVNTFEICQDLILRYGVIEQFTILNNEQVEALSLPSEPEWLECYKSSKYSNVRNRLDIDQFRAPGYFDDVSVLLLSKSQEVSPEKVWVRLEETSDDDTTFRGRLLNQPYADFGVNIGDTIPVLLVETEDGRILISGNWVPV